MIEPVKTPEKTQFDRVMHTVAFATFAIAMGFLVWVLTLFFSNRQTLDIKSVSIFDSPAAQEMKLVRGDTLSFRINLCKISHLPVKVSIDLFDGEKDDVPLVSRTSYSEKDCTNLIMEGIIPESVPLGEYKIRVHVSQTLNYIKSIDDSVVIEGFTTMQKGYAVKTTKSEPLKIESSTVEKKDTVQPTEAAFPTTSSTKFEITPRAPVKSLIQQLKEVLKP